MFNSLALSPLSNLWAASSDTRMPVIYYTFSKVFGGHSLVDTEKPVHSTQLLINSLIKLFSLVY